MSNRVNRETRSGRSSVPVHVTSRVVHDIRDARVIPLNVNTKQSTTAATSSVSGDHLPPGPSNSGGVAVDMSGIASPDRTTSPVGDDVEETAYRCGKGCTSEAKATDVPHSTQPTSEASTAVRIVAARNPPRLLRRCARIGHPSVNASLADVASRGRRRLRRAVNAASLRFQAGPGSGARRPGGGTCGSGQPSRLS